MYAADTYPHGISSDDVTQIDNLSNTLDPIPDFTNNILSEIEESLPWEDNSEKSSFLRMLKILRIELNLFYICAHNFIRYLSQIEAELGVSYICPDVSIFRSAVGVLHSFGKLFGGVIKREIQHTDVFQVLDPLSSKISSKSRKLSSNQYGTMTDMDKEALDKYLTACCDALKEFKILLNVSLKGVIRVSNFFEAKPESSSGAYQVSDMDKRKDETSAKPGSDTGKKKDEISAKPELLLAEKNRRAVTEAIEEIKWEISNIYVQCVPYFEGMHLNVFNKANGEIADMVNKNGDMHLNLVDKVNVDKIADELKKELVEFGDVQILLEGVWKSAIIRFSRRCIQIIVEGREVIPKSDVRVARVKLHDTPPQLHVTPPQFTVIISCGLRRIAEKFTCKVKSLSLLLELVVTGKSFHAMNFPLRDLDWSKPEKEGWLKLNIDVFTYSPGYMGFGGVFRDETGRWVVGFWRRALRVANDVDLEVIALYEGLRIAVEENMMIEIETQSVQLEEMMNDPSYKDVDISDETYLIAAECRDMLNTRLESKYKFITLEDASSVIARELAEEGSRMKQEKLMVLCVAPDELYRLLLDERLASRCK